MLTASDINKQDNYDIFIKRQANLKKNNTFDVVYENGFPQSIQ